MARIATAPAPSGETCWAPASVRTLSTVTCPTGSKAATASPRSPTTCTTCSPKASHRRPGGTRPRKNPAVPGPGRRGLTVPSEPRRGGGKPDSPHASGEQVYQGLRSQLLNLDPADAGLKQGPQRPVLWRVDGDGVPRRTATLVALVSCALNS